MRVPFPAAKTTAQGESGLDEEAFGGVVELIAGLSGSAVTSAGGGENWLVAVDRRRSARPRRVPAAAAYSLSIGIQTTTTAPMRMPNT